MNILIMYELLENFGTYIKSKTISIDGIISDITSNYRSKAQKSAKNS